ncbi:414_t:CDS:2, partial [Funneliformis mosseae]
KKRAYTPDKEVDKVNPIILDNNDNYEVDNDNEKIEPVNNDDKEIKPPEIKAKLLSNQQASDQLDIISRMFKLKLKEITYNLFVKGPNYIMGSIKNDEITQHLNARYVSAIEAS